MAADDFWCRPDDSASASGPGGLPTADPTKGRYGSGLQPPHCWRVWTRLALTGAIRDFLASTFKGLPWLPKLLQSRVWQDDWLSDGPGDSQILIDAWYTWRDNKTGILPAVVIKPGPVRTERLALDDRQAEADESGQPSYVRRYWGAHTLFCLSQLGPSVEALAWTVNDALEHFAPRFRQDLGLHDFQVANVGEVQEVEDGPPETLGVAVDVAWAFDSRWRLDYESVKLRKVSLTPRILSGGLFG